MIAKMLICTMIMGTMLTGCGSKVADTTVTTEEATKATEETKSEKNETAASEVATITTETVTEEEPTEQMGEYESDYSEYEIRTFLPEEVNTLVPEHLDQWREYIRKMLATYDAVSNIMSTSLGTACLEYMSGNDYDDVSTFTTADKDFTGKDFNANDFGTMVVEKYIDLYVNQGKRDIDFDQLYAETTVDEVETMFDAYIGMYNAVVTIYNGLPELDGDLPFYPEFNMNANFSMFQNHDYKTYNGHEWDYEDADDNFLFGTHYLYSFYKDEVEEYNGDDVGFCWYFDKDGNLVNTAIIQKSNN